MPIPEWFEISEREHAVLFGVLLAADGSDAAVLAAVAGEFSPRIEILDAREIVLDLSGLSRLFGDAKAIGEELRRAAADRSLRTRVAVAATRTAARLMVRHRAGLSIVATGTEAATLAALPIGLLDQIDVTSQVANPEPPPATNHRPPTTVLRRWGLRTLGELAALPADEVMARLGAAGIEWQRLARGEDARPLVPSVPEERFEQSLELEWPIDGLEPLSFVLGRLIEPLSAHLQQRDRGAAVLHVRLRLVTRQLYERSLQLPAPMHEARTLRTLALLDLESHPPDAAIDCVTVAVDPTPARVVQYSLLTRPLPTPEQLSTLMARLHALMGEPRCGSPALVDTWAPGVFAMKRFAPREATAIVPGHVTGHEPHGGTKIVSTPATALRRFRMPVAARVRVENGKPVSIDIDRRGLRGGLVSTSAGPWRTSGAWWAAASNSTGAAAGAPRGKKEDAGREGGAAARPWDRDEWDVLLEDGATYRLFRERSGNQWFIDGVVD